MEDFFAKQDSGDVSAAVEAKTLLKIAGRRRMREMSRTAKALKFTIPGIEKGFLMPEGDSDQEVVARGRAMCDKHEEFETEFTNLGCPKERRNELNALLDQIEAMATTKDAAQQSVVGATAGIDATLDTGMEAATVVDAIMRNFYRNDPVTLAEWRTARHIQTVGGNPPPPGP